MGIETHMNTYLPAGHLEMFSVKFASRPKL